MKTETKVEAVLFDLDGTLIDSTNLIVRSFQHATQSLLGFSEPSTVIAAEIGLPLLEMFSRRSPEHAEELARVYRAFYAEHHDELIQGFDGVVDMLKSLSAKVPIGIVTSKTLPSAAPSLKHFGIDALMQSIVTLEQTEKHKPNPEPLLFGAEKLGIAPENCWYVGDSTHDMHAARAAQMAGIGAAWGPYGRDVLKPLAHTVIDTPKDLIALF